MEDILKKYVPQTALEALVPLLRKHPLSLKISKARKTKFGDYRFPDASGRHRISINHNLNPYAFLITLLHELAHLEAFEQHGKRIKPHGAEWQNAFRELAYPFLKANIFPTQLQQAFMQSLNRGHATSCTDINLYRALQAYNEDSTEITRVEDLPLGSLFLINKKTLFKKGPRLRKRYKCINMTNGREYMVHPLAEITEYTAKHEHG